jgi:hypothetical protein
MNSSLSETLARLIWILRLYMKDGKTEEVKEDLKE